MRVVPGPAAWRRVALVAVAAVAPSLAPAEPVKLSIDAQHSAVSFRVRHLFTRVTGQFRTFEGTLVFDPKNPAATQVTATIQAGSVDTNVEARDKDLRSRRFFDVERYPTLTFTSSAVTDVAGSKGQLKGTLTMHGVSKEVALAVEFVGVGKDPWGAQRYGFHAQGTINRKEFGMAWNEAVEAGGLLVGDDVEVTLDIEAVPAQP